MDKLKPCRRIILDGCQPPTLRRWYTAKIACMRVTSVFNSAGLCMSRGFAYAMGLIPPAQMIFAATGKTRGRRN